MELTLNDIALGDVDPKSARKIIWSVLDGSETRKVMQVYEALRTLVWRILIERRLDNDLRAWFRLLRELRASLIHDECPDAELFRPLSDLMSESIGFAEANQLEDVLRRAHVRDVLRVLQELPRGRGDGAVARIEIVRQTGLRDANLSRIMRTLIAYGLVERRPDGKRADFELTEIGRRLAMNAQEGANAGHQGSPEYNRHRRRSLPSQVAERAKAGRLGNGAPDKAAYRMEAPQDRQRAIRLTVETRVPPGSDIVKVPQRLAGASPRKGHGANDAAHGGKSSSARRKPRVEAIG